MWGVGGVDDQTEPNAVSLGLLLGRGYCPRGVLGDHSPEK
jgi:hypothetical protein